MEQQNSVRKDSVVIYGAGAGGRELFYHLCNKNEYHVAGFIDDNKTLDDDNIEGVGIYEPIHLKSIIDQYGVKIVILAIPSLPQKRRLEIYGFLNQFPVKVLTLPNLTDILLGRANTSQIYDIQLEDLLGRNVVKPLGDLLNKNITNKTVLITGAGGSIGSELARQVVKLNPKTLILFDVSEYALYTIETELKKGNDALPIFSMIGSVLDNIVLSHIYSKFYVDTVYHAAAYKHVPMVEHNPFAGVINNFIGTANCVRAAIKAGVDTFILISTDKAVRPTNIMGCSKRLSEIVCQGLAANPNHKTKISMVRFGNVLGSSGSVIPLFKRQIQEGGPVTVTHPEITRYFMTIPEASQLVIQAGAMAMGGDVFLLDMGKPVKINDLAQKMIRLSGHAIKNQSNPDGIDIIYTGLRPGEKLYEELLISGEGLQKTEHPLIIKAMEKSFPIDEIEIFESNLLKAYEDNNILWLINQLSYFVDGYIKSHLIQAY
ncbi:nucleoside-diphosphate sugar epimerase/dehydratase [Moraxella sp. VT-16-12]|uniref:polysaccharide biosynthesis protein n=1 Tax=Moraxella sp. VT-16-12 TaxID=2014877 RepID=UPI000B7D07E3|nr:nucleoside-diphosphate sugar epimerase/dehydratase [Moraxella sp. VT-16-12]TWV82422.1 polysaccharide biosynthesis protein [Moraxella sp. VT-16-12]